MKDRKGVRYCHDEVWENHKDNIRLFGTTGVKTRSLSEDSFRETKPATQ